MHGNEETHDRPVEDAILPDGWREGEDLFSPDGGTEAAGGDSPTAGQYVPEDGGYGPADGQYGGTAGQYGGTDGGGVPAQSPRYGPGGVGAVLPADGGGTADGFHRSAGGGVPGAGGDGVPAGNGGGVPGSGTVPGDAGDRPDGTVPVNGGTVPGNGGTVPGSGASVPVGSAARLRTEAQAARVLFPELRELPDEVAVAIASGGGLLGAYAGYRAREAERLRLENDRLRQNQEALLHAPVRGVAGGGAGGRPVSDFERGFDSDGW